MGGLLPAVSCSQNTCCLAFALGPSSGAFASKLPRALVERQLAHGHSYLGFPARMQNEHHIARKSHLESETIAQQNKSGAALRAGCKLPGKEERSINSGLHIA